MNTRFLSSKQGHRKSVMRLLATTSVLATAPLAQAAVTVSNLGIQDAGTAGWGVYTTQFIGMSFTVGSDYGSWDLDSVTIKAYSASGSPTSSPFIVELHADDGSGRPAVTSLATLTGVDPSTLGEYSFVPTAPFTLGAGLTYWLTAESLGSGPTGYGWVMTEPQSGAESTALTGWSIGNNIAASGDQGASWAAHNLNPTKFAVNATGVVPEPGSLGLLALGGLAAATRRRRRVPG